MYFFIYGMTSYDHHESIIIHMYHNRSNYNTFRKAPNSLKICGYISKVKDLLDLILN